MMNTWPLDGIEPPSPPPANPFCHRYCITICLAGRVVTRLAPVQVSCCRYPSICPRRLLLCGVSQSLPESASDGCTCWIFFFYRMLLLWLLLLTGNLPHHISERLLGRFVIHVTLLGFHRGERIPPCGNEEAMHANIVNNLLPLRSE